MKGPGRHNERRAVSEVELVFCTDLTGVPEVEAAYADFWHEAEVSFYPLANAVQAGAMTPEEGRKAFEPYRRFAPWIYDPEETEEHENGFPSAEWFTEWGPGPGSEDFWRAADDLGVPGVIYSEGDHPGGGPYFEVRSTEALAELGERLKDRYRIVARAKIDGYDTSGSIDPQDAAQIIRGARRDASATGWQEEGTDRQGHEA